MTTQTKPVKAKPQVKVNDLKAKKNPKGGVTNTGTGGSNLVSGGGKATPDAKVG